MGEKILIMKTLNVIFHYLLVFISSFLVYAAITGGLLFFLSLILNIILSLSASPPLRQPNVSSRMVILVSLHLVGAFFAGGVFGWSGRFLKYYLCIIFSLIVGILYGHYVIHSYLAFIGHPAYRLDIIIVCLITIPVNILSAKLFTKL